MRNLNLMEKEINRSAPLPSISDVRNFVSDWNSRFPIDKWWRFKHKVAFGSEAHLNASFVYMLVEYEEDMMYENYFKNLRDKENDKKNDVYIPGSGDIFKAESFEMSKEEADDLYDSIDISSFNKKPESNG